MIISPKTVVNTLPSMVDSPSRIFEAKRNATQSIKNVATVKMALVLSAIWR
jgi:hypothetical protein